MKVLYDECIEALRDNKCSECNDFYQCSVCDYFQEQYEKGRADKYQEIVSEYMLLTEEQVAEIRADAIEEFANWLPKRLRFNNNPKVWIDEYFNQTSEKILKQLKEQK